LVVISGIKLIYLERMNFKHLVAKVDPENVASTKIVIKAGARKGELLKDSYPRAVNNGKLSDMVCWYLDRPQMGVEHLSKTE
jgi:RimJ/RimL family protein N-acetyltransferase